MISIFLLGLISIGINGYYFGFLDHQHYLPLLNKILNTNLYPNDYYFSQPHGLYSPFNYALTAFAKLFHISLSTTDLIFYLFTLWLLYFGIYRLSLVLHRKKAIGLMAIFLFLIPKWAAQIGYLTHHFYFISRDLSLAVSLLALVQILQLKRLKSFGLLLVAAFINPTIPVPLGIFWLIRFLKIKTGFKSWGFVPLSWVEIIKQRGTYSFPHLWTWKGWGNLILFFSLFVPGYQVLKTRIFGSWFKPMVQFLTICSVLFIGHALMALVWPNPWLIQLQILRSVNFIFIIALITFAAAGYRLLTRGPWLTKAVAMISLAGVYFWGDHLTIWHFLAIWLLPAYLVITKVKLVKTANRRLPLIFIGLLLAGHLGFKLLVIKPEIFWPYYWHYPNAIVQVADFRQWLEVQIWAKNNTSVDAVFLVPPQSAGFRSFSERGIVADAKDGGAVFYSAEYASSWQGRLRDLRSYDLFSKADFENLNQQYPFDYLVVASSQQKLDFYLVFQNQGFVVYKL